MDEHNNAIIEAIQTMDAGPQRKAAQQRIRSAVLSAAAQIRREMPNDRDAKRALLALRYAVELSFDALVPDNQGELL